MKVSNIRSTPGAQEHYRIEADVDGEILWFASDDIELTASPEAFASALLVPAAYHGELL